MDWKTTFWIGYLLTWGFIPVILLQNRRPVSTLSWIWTILLFPYLGALAFFLFGDIRMVRKHLRKTKVMEARSGAPKKISEETRRLLETLNKRDRDFAHLLCELNIYPTSTAYNAQLLVDAQQFYPALQKRVEQAKHHVHVFFFIFKPDRYGRELLQSLTAAAKRGVEVRLLCDQGGKMDTHDEFFQPLLDAGGKFAWFRTVNPFQNRWIFHLRNHRKLQIIDGEHAFVGGMNVGKEYASQDPELGRWRDMQIEFSGAAAGQVQRTFTNDWYFATGEELVDHAYYPDIPVAPKYPVQICVDGPDNPHDPMVTSIVALLNHAEKKAWLTAGYFVPSEPLLTALKLCASRGVDTRLLITKKSDHPYLSHIGHSYYEELLTYGVRIFEYEPGIHHAKVAAIDEEWVMVGSANFDIRSMQLNFELNTIIRDPENLRRLQSTLEKDYTDSTEVDLKGFRNRPWHKKAIESIVRPLSPLV